MVSDNESLLKAINNFGRIVTKEVSTSVPISNTSIDYKSKGTPQTVFGGKGAAAGEFNVPGHVAVSPVTGNIVVTDSNNHRVQIFSNKGKFVSQFGSSGSGKDQFELWPRSGVAVTPTGNIIISDTNNHRLQLYTEKCQHFRSIGSKGTAGGQFNSPLGVATDGTGLLYVCNWGNSHVQVLDQRGTVIKVIGKEKAVDGWFPQDVSVSPDGDVIVTYWKYEDDTSKIEVFRSSGEHKSTLCKGQPGSVRLNMPLGVAVDWEGNIIVTDASTHTVHIMRPDGQLIHTFGSRGNKSGALYIPVGVCCTQDGQLAVVDKNDHRIQIF